MKKFIALATALLLAGGNAVAAEAGGAGVFGTAVGTTTAVAGVSLAAIGVAVAVSDSSNNDTTSTSTATSTTTAFSLACCTAPLRDRARPTATPRVRWTT